MSVNGRDTITTYSGATTMAKATKSSKPAAKKAAPKASAKPRARKSASK